MSSSGISRRRFVGRVALGAASVAIVPRHVLGGPGQKSPNDRINIGGIGVGRRGGYVLRAVGGVGGCQTVAACDADRKLVSKYEKKNVRAYTDFREMLDRGDIDAVTIGTPDHWHAIPAITAAKAGKDVYCEKPLSLTIREARAMANAVRRSGRVFQTGTQQRSDGKMRRACELVRSGRIGKLLRVHVNFPNFRGAAKRLRVDLLPAEPVPEGLDWDMWLGPAPWRPYNRGYHPSRGWIYHRDFSGGHGVTGWGSHHFDIAQWGIDADDTGPVEIIPPDGKDNKHLAFRYASGVVMYHGGGKSAVNFVGAEGEVWTNRGKLGSEPESIARSPLGADDVHLYESRNHAGNFIECIRTRKKPVSDVEITCRSVTLCHLTNIAYSLGRPLEWDPEKEEFVGDEGANRLLGRPKRAPWRL